MASLTPIKKTVKRRADTTLARYGRDRRSIVVSIQPGDVLGFRLLGTRKEYLLGIDTAMLYAIKLAVDQKRREKALLRKAKKEGRA